MKKTKILACSTFLFLACSSQEAFSSKLSSCVKKCHVHYSLRLSELRRCKKECYDQFGYQRKTNNHLKANPRFYDDLVGPSVEEDIRRKSHQMATPEASLQGPVEMQPMPMADQASMPAQPEMMMQQPMPMADQASMPAQPEMMMQQPMPMADQASMPAQPGAAPSSSSFWDDPSEGETDFMGNPIEP